MEEEKERLIIATENALVLSVCVCVCVCVCESGSKSERERVEMFEEWQINKRRVDKFTDIELP